MDLLVHPQLAKGDQIVAIPTLVRKIPQPIRKVIGDLSNVERTLVGLQLRPRQDESEPTPLSARAMKDGTARDARERRGLSRENENSAAGWRKPRKPSARWRSGEADAVLVEAAREQVFTLQRAETPYWLMVEQISQAAATLTAEGTFISCNGRFCRAAPAAVSIACQASRCATSSPPTAVPSFEALMREGLSTDDAGRGPAAAGGWRRRGLYLGFRPLRKASWARA